MQPDSDKWWPYMSQSSDKRLRQLLRASRVAAGITQKELASRLRLHPVYVNNVEAGKDGRNWFRYLPKVLAWMEACGVELRFVVEAKRTDVVKSCIEKKDRELFDSVTDGQFSIKRRKKR